MLSLDRSEPVRTDRIPRGMRRAVGLGAVVVAVLGCLAPSAYADAKRSVDTDSVKVAAEGFDFGDGTMVAGGLTDSAEVDWKVDDNDVTPVLTGEMHVRDNDDCARLRVDYYTSGEYHLLTDYGPTRCASPVDDDWEIEMSSFSSDNVGKVRVRLQRQLSNGDWDGVGTDWATLSTLTSSVKMSSYQGANNGYDFGGDSLEPLDSTPIGFGKLEWNFSGGRISPHLTGTLHLDNVAGECARIRLDYWADDGDLNLGVADDNMFGDKLTTEYSNSVCPDDDLHHRYTIDMEPYDHELIDKLYITIESRQGNGAWSDEDRALYTFGY